jgi:uncharacterized membrane protein
MLVLDMFLLYIKEFIAAIGVLVIVMGAVRSLYQLFMILVGKDFTSSYIRWQFGESVILGLEFMVGADIVGSMVQPDYYNLGLLAILVLIRTVLSYFLNMELATLTPHQQKKLK